MFQSAGSSQIPKYRLHRPSGQAVARFNGIDYYLGKHGSQESRDEYDRFLGEWMIKGRQPPPQIGAQFCRPDDGQRTHPRVPPVC